ncbi:hypothetical protein U1Q18_044731 [Sarracenia purpurea var. burkii]
MSLTVSWMRSGTKCRKIRRRCSSCAEYVTEETVFGRKTGTTRCTRKRTTPFAGRKVWEIPSHGVQFSSGPAGPAPWHPHNSFARDGLSLEIPVLLIVLSVMLLSWLCAPFETKSTHSKMATRISLLAKRLT